MPQSTSTAEIHSEKSAMLYFSPAAVKAFSLLAPPVIQFTPPPMTAVLISGTLPLSIYIQEGIYKLCIGEIERNLVRSNGDLGSVCFFNLLNTEGQIPKARLVQVFVPSSNPKC